MIHTFADGAAAWEAFEHDPPDLAILDILMPRMDGLELCRRLRGLSDSLPIIFLTSRDEEFDRVLGLELGADDPVLLLQVIQSAHQVGLGRPRVRGRDRAHRGRRG